MGKGNMHEVSKIGVPSGFTCPDCGGALFELCEGRPARLLCHTGMLSAFAAWPKTQEQVTDVALWASLRALQETEAILRRLAVAQGEEAPGSGTAALGEADRLDAFINRMRQVVSSAPNGIPDEDPCDSAEKPSTET